MFPYPSSVPLSPPLLIEFEPMIEVNPFVSIEDTEDSTDSIQTFDGGRVDSSAPTLPTNASLASTVDIFVIRDRISDAKVIRVEVQVVDKSNLLSKIVSVAAEEFVRRILHELIISKNSVIHHSGLKLQVCC